MKRELAADVVQAIDKEIRDLNDERERVVRRHSHFVCDSCDWYCADLACSEEHATR
jgi:hypothetical protein